MDPGERARTAGRRLAEPVESVAQHVTRRVTEFAAEAVDMNALLDQVDVDRVLRHVDVNALLDRVDVDRILAHVDVNALLDRIDVDRILTRVDMQALLNQVDVNELAERVDVDALLDQTEFRAILSRSSGTVLSEGIDLVRSQAVGLDEFLARWVSRILRRGHSGVPGMPRTLSLQAER
jgi:hypothetical protein